MKEFHAMQLPQQLMDSLGEFARLYLDGLQSFYWMLMQSAHQLQADLDSYQDT
jgi:hypothetical protein